MKYETVIKLLTDAESEHEAVDIAGEFLRGNIETGVSMKCFTKPVKPYRLFCNQTKRSLIRREG